MAQEAEQKKEAAATTKTTTKQQPPKKPAPKKSPEDVELEMEAKRLRALEAKAVAEATATADAAFTPSPSLLNASSATVLLKQVDGPSLKDYEGKESIYVGRSVPVTAGGALAVPIQVTTPGSVVEYAVENKQYDIGFGITAEREEGVTVVKEPGRSQASTAPITGKFLVGSVPCLLRFKFENDYSWFREKVISYKVTVTPPSRDTLSAGRRRRAKACLTAVGEDLKSAQKRLTGASVQKSEVESELEALERQLEQKKKSMAVVVAEEKWLKERVSLRKEQQRLLNDRLIEGWADEKPEQQQQSSTSSSSIKANGK
eukprot:CAMPEP_0117032838 /NCGR_PEP_ID=MMETSP0472-20121206/23511_1 /TAXON_ID=693140 ORGANISM="Tiarina fusus, Strain LIS" /NCGR_SAMPLE_ID=MMETSP0472 /ASSEMBLY_ACC=CAM_ASM_000603 /LENGTH=315 /DNA_ID=CAMNT_0004741593 /DNA_START=257 /DNA_END=1204 /DNA_ORIENTATION=+